MMPDNPARGHLDEGTLVLFHYRESPDRQAIEEHLSVCNACRADYEDLRETLRVMDDVPVPERSAGYGSQVWWRVRPAIAKTEGRWWSPAAYPRRWALAAAILVMVLAAFLAGRLSQEPEMMIATTESISEETRERILLVAVGDHLERSQMMLVELANLNGRTGPDTPTHFDISAGRDTAEELVATGRLYRQSAARAGDVAVAWVLEELERILLDIAHSPSEVTHAELRALQERIEQRGILLKVRVIGSQVRDRERTRTDQKTSSDRT